MAKKPYKPKWRPLEDPNAAWNAPEIDVGAVLVQCDRVRRKINDAPADVWKKAVDFFSDLDKRIEEMRERIAGSQRATNGQQEALNNWEKAVDRCLADGTKNG